MYAEIIDGDLVQVVEDAAPITTADGIQHSGNEPKGAIPNLVAVVDPGAPDPLAFLVTGTRVTLVDGVPTKGYSTEDVPPPAPSPPPVIRTPPDPVRLQIMALERSQARPLRELALGVPGSLDRVKAIDDQIAVLRAQLAQS